MLKELTADVDFALAAVLGQPASEVYFWGEETMTISTVFSCIPCTNLANLCPFIGNRQSTPAVRLKISVSSTRCLPAVPIVTYYMGWLEHPDPHRSKEGRHHTRACFAAGEATLSISHCKLTSDLDSGVGCRESSTDSPTRVYLFQGARS
jgi:hypothetical protein